MAPEASFNDGSQPDSLPVMVASGRVENMPSLRTPVSAYERHIRYTVLEFEELLDSSSIDAKGWAEIARTIHRNYQLFDAFVVLHGTDSLAYTCSALSFMLQNLGKPVIFTGSQVPMVELLNDARGNLLGSLIIAGHYMIAEVALFFHNRLYRGNRVTKVSASDFDAFASPNCPPLASIDSMKTQVSWSLIYRPTHIDPFSIQTDLDITHVACLRIFPGIKPEMVDGVLRLDGLRGLVLETFGAGNAPKGTDSAMTKVIADGVRRGIVIVNVTQCLAGNVSPLYAPANILGQAGVVFGHDLTSEAALTKLSYLLALPNLTTKDVVRQMSVSIRGELTEQSKPLFEHPKNSLTPSLASLTALGYAIAQGDLEAVRGVMRGEPEWLLNEADYDGNTPLGSTARFVWLANPAGAQMRGLRAFQKAHGRRSRATVQHLAATRPNVDIVREFLSQGASVHLRNRAGRTPLFLAAKAGLKENVLLLRQSGAHLHSSELGRAWMQSISASNAPIWTAAGLPRNGNGA
ncbi:MAG: hypothetical protein M1823_004028 [Watsoniomyces obsoletus]|nr:MAG: hypothetical protein M1823_004028 [Watsoniomyces obsoletus]